MVFGNSLFCKALENGKEVGHSASIPSQKLVYLGNVPPFLACAHGIHVGINVLNGSHLSLNAPELRDWMNERHGVAWAPIVLSLLVTSDAANGSYEHFSSISLKGALSCTTHHGTKDAKWCASEKDGSLQSSISNSNCKTKWTYTCKVNVWCCFVRMRDSKLRLLAMIGIWRFFCFNEVETF